MSTTNQPQKLNPNLTPEQEDILFGRGTELPGSGKYLTHNEQGQYCCVNCGAVLFSSDAKYESRTPGLVGWPSFGSAVGDAVELRPDDSLGMSRTEVLCKQCGVHLGHVFDAPDAPEDGKHFCINSSCLDFQG